MNIVSRRLDSPLETVLLPSFACLRSMMPQCTRDGSVLFVQQHGEEQPQLCRMRLDGSGFTPLAPGASPGSVPMAASLPIVRLLTRRTPWCTSCAPMAVTVRTIAPGFANALSPNGAHLYYTQVTKTDAGSEIGDVLGINLTMAQFFCKYPRR